MDLIKYFKDECYVRARVQYLQKKFIMIKSFIAWVWL